MSKHQNDNCVPGCGLTENSERLQEPLARFSHAVCGNEVWDSGRKTSQVSQNMSGQLAVDEAAKAAAAITMDDDDHGDMDGAPKASISDSGHGTVLVPMGTQLATPAVDLGEPAAAVGHMKTWEALVLSMTFSTAGSNLMFPSAFGTFGVTSLSSDRILCHDRLPLAGGTRTGFVPRPHGLYVHSHAVGD